MQIYQGEGVRQCPLIKLYRIDRFERNRLYILYCIVRRRSREKFLKMQHSNELIRILRGVILIGHFQVIKVDNRLDKFIFFFGVLWSCRK